MEATWAVLLRCWVSPVTRLLSRQHHCCSAGSRAPTLLQTLQEPLEPSLAEAVGTAAELLEPIICFCCHSCHNQTTRAEPAVPTPACLCPRCCSQSPWAHVPEAFGILPPPLPETEAEEGKCIIFSSAFNSTSTSQWLTWAHQRLCGKGVRVTWLWGRKVGDGAESLRANNQYLHFLCTQWDRDYTHIISFNPPNDH